MPCIINIAHNAKAQSHLCVLQMHCWYLMHLHRVCAAEVSLHAHQCTVTTPAERHVAASCMQLVRTTTITCRMHCMCSCAVMNLILVQELAEVCAAGL